MRLYLTVKKELTSNSPLSEHLRPKSFDELTLDEKMKSRLQKMHLQNNVMNMLFFGKGGTGKTTAALILAQNDLYDASYFDISNNSSIEFVRESIIEAAFSPSLYGNKRLLILDEADALSVPNQNALKVTIEQTSEYCRFIFITNNPDKIIEPIKSRLKLVCFDQIPKDFDSLVSSHIERVVEKMKAIHSNLSECEINEITSIVKRNYPDYRKIANEIDFEFY
jgi:DNA polymerase III delta prime subunit